MANDEIPEDLRRFILTSIPSVPYLEALLLLRGQPREWWDSKRVAQRLHVSEKVSRAILEEQGAVGIAAVDPSGPLYRYQPGSEELRSMIDRLAKFYASHLVEVTNLIHSETSKMAQHFADAFKWWKE
jgi:Mn-dependent DtxR family transcriptional regulator